MHHNMHLQPGVAKQPKLELKTQPKQLLGSLPLVIALPSGTLRVRACTHRLHRSEKEREKKREKTEGWRGREREREGGGEM
jgi:hypothetical protein